MRKKISVVMKCRFVAMLLTPDTEFQMTGHDLGEVTMTTLCPLLTYQNLVPKFADKRLCRLIVTESYSKLQRETTINMG